jgi:hypothetical protein
MVSLACLNSANILHVCDVLVVSLRFVHVAVDDGGQDEQRHPPVSSQDLGSRQPRGLRLALNERQRHPGASCSIDVKLAAGSRVLKQWVRQAAVRFKLRERLSQHLGDKTPLTQAPNHDSEFHVQFPPLRL